MTDGLGRSASGRTAQSPSWGGEAVSEPRGTRRRALGQDDSWLLLKVGREADYCGIWSEMWST